MNGLAGGGNFPLTLPSPPEKKILAPSCSSSSFEDGLRTSVSGRALALLALFLAVSPLLTTLLLLLLPLLLPLYPAHASVVWDRPTGDKKEKKRKCVPESPGWTLSVAPFFKQIFVDQPYGGQSQSFERHNELLSCMDIFPPLELEQICPGSHALTQSVPDHFLSKKRDTKCRDSSP